MNRGIMLNIDDTHFYSSRYRIGAHPDEAQLRAYIGQYAGTHVTDLMLCAAGRMADYPSGAVESFLDKYHQTRENGLEVDYTRTLLAVPRELYEEKGLDPYAIWIDDLPDGLPEGLALIEIRARGAGFTVDYADVTIE